MSDTEFKKYNTKDAYEIHDARLSKDATVLPGNKGNMVKISFASETTGADKEGQDRYSTLWVEGSVNDFNADAAAFLKKNDVLGVRGKPALRLWGDGKFSFELVRCELFMSPELMKKLKERGWVPGQKTDAKAAGQPNKKGASKPAAKPAGKPKKEIVEIPDDDEDSDTPEE